MLKSTKIIPNPYEEIAVFRDGVFHFDFRSVRNGLKAQGKQIFGPHFRIIPEDQGLLFTLLIYATGDKETAAGRGIDLKKGILLSGPVGCGKTSLMTLVNFFMPKGKRNSKSNRPAKPDLNLNRRDTKTIDKYSQSMGPKILQIYFVSMIWASNSHRNTLATNVTSWPKSCSAVTICLFLKGF